MPKKMKFGKEFTSQMVPEWQEAYMDYNFLKAVLKDILRIIQRNPSAPIASTPEGTLRRNVSLYRAFSGLTNRGRGSPRKKEDEAILVSSDQQDGSEGHYHTLFLTPSGEGDECELVFFGRLDNEFNKVVNFYKMKVGEVMEEAEELSKQMDVLIALRLKVEKPVVRLGGGAYLRNLASIGASSPSISCPLNRRKPGGQHMDAIQEVEMSGENKNEEEEEEEEERRGNEPETRNHRNADGGKVDIQGFRPASLEILNHVKLNVLPETPVSTLRRLLMSTTTDLSFSKEELRKAEELMIQALTEFYQKLRLLKSYW